MHFIKLVFSFLKSGYDSMIAILFLYEKYLCFCDMQIFDFMCENVGMQIQGN